MNTTSGHTLDTEKADLCWRIKVTAGSRFNAAQRLGSRDTVITILNAVASIAVIFLSVVSASVKTGEAITIILALFSILSSIAILVTSLFQYALKDAVQAERMQTCAQILAELRYRLTYTSVSSRQELLEFAKEYNSVIARYPNHATVDYEKYRDDHPTEFRDGSDGGAIRGREWTPGIPSRLIAAIAVAIAVGTLASGSTAIIKQMIDLLKIVPP